MPILDPEIRVELINKGLNPDEYDFVEEESPVTTAPTPNVVQAKPSMLGAAGRSFARGILPTMAGIAGGTATGSFVGGPIGTVVGGIAGGVTSAIAAKKAQDFIANAITPRYGESEAEDYATQPLASTIGGIAANAPFLAASLRSLPGAFRAGRDILTKPVTGVAPQADDLGNLLNVGLGATLPTGIRAISDPEVSGGELLAEAIGGGLFNDPTRLGRRLGLSPNTYRPNVKTKGTLKERQPIAQIPERVSPIEAPYTSETAAVIKAKNANAMVKYEPPTFSKIEQDLRNAPVHPEVQEYNRAQEELRLEQERVKLETEKFKAQAEELRRATAAPKTELETLQDTMVSRQVTEPEVSTTVNRDLVDYQKRQAKTETELAKPPTEAEEIQAQFDRFQDAPEGTGKIIAGRKYTPAIEMPNGEIKVGKTHEELGMGWKRKGYVTPEGKFVTLTEAVRDSGRYQDKTTETPKQRFTETLPNLATARNVEVIGQQLPGAGETTVRGPEDFGKKQVKINPEKAGPDTLPHEILHHHIVDLKTKGTSFDKKFVSDTFKKIEADPEYQAWKNSLKDDSNYKNIDEEVKQEEWLAKKSGVDVVRRVADDTITGNTKNYISDFWSNVKRRRGVETLDDYIKIMSRRTLLDPSFDQSFKPTSIKTKGQADERRNEQENRRPIEGSRFSTRQRSETERGTTNRSTTGSGEDSLQRSQDTREELSGDNQGRGQTERTSTSGSAQSTRTERSGAAKSGEGRERGNRGREVDETEGRIEGGEKIVDATYRGAMESGETKLHLYDLNEDIIRDGEVIHPKGSTVSDKNLERLGYRLPDTNVRQQDSSEITNIDKPERRSHLIPDVFRPVLDKVRDNFPEIADSFDNFDDKLKEFRGRFINNPIRAFRSMVKFSPSDYIKNDNADLQNLQTYLWDLKAGRTPTVEPRQVLLQEHNRLMREVGEERNSREGLHQGELKDNYIPDIVDRKVIQELNEKPNSPESKKLIEDYYAYHRDVNGLKDPVIKDMLDTFRKSFSNPAINRAKQFGPLDKAEGLGLPESWRERNYLDIIHSYSERTARRLAHYDAIETKPEIVKQLETNMGNSHVAAYYRNIASVEPVAEAFRNAVSGVVRAGMMGTLTGAKDFVSNLALGFQHHQNPVQVVRSAIDSWKNIKTNIAESFEMGRNRVNINSLEMGDGIGTDVISSLRRFRDILASAQGRNWLEQMTRATAYGQGKFLALDFKQQMKEGKLSKAGEKFFKDFAKRDIDWKKGELSESDIKKLAARYVDSVQGTYGYQGLPAIAVEGSFAPYLSLARWSIEKANNYNKYVVTPLINGNPQPFLMSTIGMFIGGAAVNEVVEQMTGRKQKTATVKELKAAKADGKNIVPDVLYKGVGLAAASGYAGAITDLMKTSYDYIYGKNKPQVYNNVLIEAADNNISTLANMIAAVGEDGITPDLVYEATSKILEDNLQAARILMGMLNRDDIDKANKFRDLRVFNTLYGNPKSDLRSQYVENFDDLDVKKYKKAETIEEAIEILPDLLRNAIEDSEGDVEKLKSELRKIKQNSFQTLPSPSSMPQSFLRYIQFLSESQGEDEAMKRLQDYLLRNRVNKVKSALIP